MTMGAGGLLYRINVRMLSEDIKNMSLLKKLKNVFFFFIKLIVSAIRFYVQSTRL